MAGPTREVPVCTVFLALGTLAAHLLVLVGNLTTSNMLHSLGQSTTGWSGVGKSIADAMQNDLTPAMSNVSFYLSESIQVISDLQETTDFILAETGSATDKALATYDGTEGSRKQFKDKLVGELRNLTSSLVQHANPLVDKLMALMQPVMEHLQVWLESFGSRVQPTISEFTGTIDKVQKLFDQILAQFSGPAGTNEAVMVHTTYNLFDADNSGTIYPDDLVNVATLFGISALSGKKGEELFNKYDDDGKGGLDKKEFAVFVNDPSIPGIMEGVLRKYSQAMSEVGGRLADGRMRDEIAVSVVDYLQIITTKNLTCMRWVAQALTNGSMPIQFTADVLRELAVAVDDPNVVSVVDTGAFVISAMVSLNGEYFVKALRLLSDAGYWASEGFPGDQQAAAIARLVNWMASTEEGPALLRQGGLHFDQDGDGESHGDAAFRSTQESQDKFAASHLLNKSHSQAAIYGSAASRYLRSVLLGGNGAAAAGDNPDADNLVQAGVAALPATLKFAGFLSHNATRSARRHLEECFTYSGKSSGALDSAATQISGVFSKVQAFLNTMSMYATPQGSLRLVNQSLEFVRGAADDIVLVCEEYLDAQLAEIDCQLSGGRACNMTVQQRDMALDLSGAFTFVTGTMSDLKTVLPTVVQDLKFAKTSMSNFAKGLDQVMTVMGVKAPPVLYQAAALYKALWVCYFLFFGLVSVGVLFYGFWGSGWFGGPQADGSAEEAAQAAAGWPQRLRSCWSCCTVCVRGCHDSSLCFWSFMLLAEVLVLLLYIVSVLICIVGGLQVFLGSGCAQVYILGDATVCQTALSAVNVFLKTFWQKPYPMEQACTQEQLLTCGLISSEVLTGVLLAVIGGVLAASMSFWMIIESAAMHERARIRRFLDGEAKPVSEAAATETK